MTLDRSKVWTGTVNAQALDPQPHVTVGLYDTTLRDGEQTVGVVLDAGAEARDRPRARRRSASTGSRPASRASPRTTGARSSSIAGAGLAPSSGASRGPSRRTWRRSSSSASRRP